MQITDNGNEVHVVCSAPNNKEIIGAPTNLKIYSHRVTVLNIQLLIFHLRFFKLFLQIAYFILELLQFKFTFFQDFSLLLKLIFKLFFILN